MDDGEGGRWLDPPLLPRLPDPPEDRIVVRGAQLVSVFSPPETLRPGRSDGGTYAVVVAWARLGDGAWGALLAWGGRWQGADNRTTARPRWGWGRVLEELVKVRPPLSPDPPGRLWHGSWERSSLDDAMHHAAVELPPELRAAALMPRPWTG